PPSAGRAKRSHHHYHYQRHQTQQRRGRRRPQCASLEAVRSSAENMAAATSSSTASGYGESSPVTTFPFSEACQPPLEEPHTSRSYSTPAFSPLSRRSFTSGEE